MSQKYSKEAKRFDIAKDALKGLLAGNSLGGQPDADVYLMYARDAVAFADALMYTLAQKPQFTDLIAATFLSSYPDPSGVQAQTEIEDEAQKDREAQAEREASIHREAGETWDEDAQEWVVTSQPAPIAAVAVFDAQTADSGDGSANEPPMVKADEDPEVIGTNTSTPPALLGAETVIAEREFGDGKIVVARVETADSLAAQA